MFERCDICHGFIRSSATRLEAVQPYLIATWIGDGTDGLRKSGAQCGDPARAFAGRLPESDPYTTAVIQRATTRNGRKLYQVLGIARKEATFAANGVT
jgi:hypothetical protein